MRRQGPGDQARLRAAVEPPPLQELLIQVPQVGGQRVPDEGELLRLKLLGSCPIVRLSPSPSLLY